MTELSKIVETFDWVERNISGAIRSFSIGYPLWDSEVHVGLANRTRYIILLQSLADQLPRYSSIFLMRVWDRHPDAQSFFKLRNQISQNSSIRTRPEFADFESQIACFENDDSWKILKQMRDKMMAHTEGVVVGPSNSMPMVQYKKVLDETISAADGIQSLILPQRPSFKELARQWEEDRGVDLKCMLQSLVAAECE